MKKISVAFFGTPDFSVPALEVLHNHPHVDLKFVISMPDRKSGRGQKVSSPAVIEYAKTNKIKFFQTANINKEEDFISNLEKDGIDCFIVLAFAQFLGSKVLSLPKLGCFNIHTSLLPKYRGAAPIQYALLNGDESTGVSIQRMVKKMDAGNITAEHHVPIKETETGGQLYTRLKFQAALTLNDFIYDVVNNNISEKVQVEEAVCFAPTLSKDDGHIKFSESSFDSIWNKVRALKPWPGTYSFLNDKRLKIIEIEKYPSKSLAPGEIEFNSSKLLVGCIDSTIRLTTIQLEGKKVCSDIDLYNGFKDKELTLR